MFRGTGCRITQVHFTYLPNGQPDGKAYVEFGSDFDQQRAMDFNDCNVGIQDIVGDYELGLESIWCLENKLMASDLSEKWLITIFIWFSVDCVKCCGFCVGFV